MAALAQDLRAGRIPWALVVSALTDLGVFVLLTQAGWHYGLAHIASFTVGWGLWWALARERRLTLMQRLASGLLALLLRGAVLALLAGRLGVAPQLAILAAILASSATLSEGQRRGAGRWPALALALAAYSLVLRALYLPAVDLFPEEAYYWNYAQHPALGYLDHPPMVAWLIRAGTAVFGQNEFGVRIGALLCAALASVFVWRSTRDLYGRAAAAVALALMQLLPAYVLSSLFMTPDTPLVAAWAAALYFLQRALLAGEGRAWWGAGAALGLGLLCKYTIGLLVPATLLFVLLDPQARAWLRRPMPYVAGLLALLIFTPVIWWNAHNGWASFAFQTSQRLAERPRFSLFSLAGTALVLLSPVVLVAVPWLLRGPRLPEPPEVRRLRFARIFTLVPLSVFVLFSLRHTIKLDWTGPVWLAIVPLLAQASLDGDACGLPRWMRRAWSALAVCLLLLYGSLLHYMTLGLPGVPYSANPLPLPVVWRDLGFKVEAIAGAAPPGAAPLVVAMNRYMLASELAFYSSDPVRSARNTTSQNLFGLSGLMYERWFPAAAQTGRSLLLVALEPAEMADARLAPYVDQLGPVQTGTLQRNGRTTGVFYYRTAGGYHLPAP